MTKGLIGRPVDKSHVRTDSFPMVIASSMASSSAPDSLRMWLAYIPPCRFATFASAMISSVFAYVPGL